MVDLGEKGVKSHVCYFNECFGDIDFRNSPPHDNDTAISINMMWFLGTVLKYHNHGLWYQIQSLHYFTRVAFNVFQSFLFREMGVMKMVNEFPFFVDNEFWTLPFKTMKICNSESKAIIQANSIVPLIEALTLYSLVGQMTLFRSISDGNWLLLSSQWLDSSLLSLAVIFGG